MNIKSLTGLTKSLDIDAGKIEKVPIHLKKCWLYSEDVALLKFCAENVTYTHTGAPHVDWLGYGITKLRERHIRQSAQYRLNHLKEYETATELKERHKKNGTYDE